MNNREQIQAIRSVVAYASTMFVAALLMMWGTMNLVANILDMMRGPAGRDWFVSSLLIVATCLVPFAAGLWMVLRTMKKSKTASQETD